MLHHNLYSNLLLLKTFTAVNKIPSAAGAKDQKFFALRWLLLKKHQKCLECQVGVARTDGAIIQQSLNVVDKDTTQGGSICVIKILELEFTASLFCIHIFLYNYDLITVDNRSLIYCYKIQTLTCFSIILLELRILDVMK